MAYAAWIAAARCDASRGASGLTYRGRKRGSIPLTASNTDADTKATTRPVTFGAVPAVRTVVFITAIHYSTESGVAADTRSGQAANSAAISISAALRAVAPIPCRSTDSTYQSRSDLVACTGMVGPAYSPTQRAKPGKLRQNGAKWAKGARRP